MNELRGSDGGGRRKQTVSFFFKQSQLDIYMQFTLDKKRDPITINKLQLEELNFSILYGEIVQYVIFAMPLHFCFIILPSFTSPDKILSLLNELDASLRLHCCIAWLRKVTNNISNNLQHVFCLFDFICSSLFLALCVKLLLGVFSWLWSRLK